MGVPDILKFFSREYPEALTRLATAEEIRRRKANASSSSTAFSKPQFDYVIVDMSNILQTIGVQLVANLLMHQIDVRRAIILVGDGNRQRAGTKREARMVRADKDVDTGIAQLASQLRSFFASGGAAGEETSAAVTAAAAGRRQRTSTEAEEGNNSNNNNKGDNKNSSVAAPPLIVCVGSDVYGEGDFKLLNIHRQLALSNSLPKFSPASSTTNSNNKFKQLLEKQQQQQHESPDSSTAATPAPSFLFVSEDSDVFCGALCGPDPHRISVATTFRDVLSELCLLSVGACSDGICKSAGLSDFSNVYDPAERQRCVLNVGLDLITLFTILLGNGQCPALAKGATRVDSKAIWQAYCQLRWPDTKANATLAIQYPRGQFLVDGFSSRIHNGVGGGAPATTADQQREIASSLVINCGLLSSVLAHFHSGSDDPIAHAPVAEQRKLARDYLTLVARSAFRYSSGACIDTREENGLQSLSGNKNNNQASSSHFASGGGGASLLSGAPSLASLMYVAEDAAFRFYPQLTCSMEFGVKDGGGGGGSNNNSSNAEQKYGGAKRGGGSAVPAFIAPAMRGFTSPYSASSASFSNSNNNNNDDTNSATAAACAAPFSVYVVGSVNPIQCKLSVELPTSLAGKSSNSGGGGSSNSNNKRVTFADVRAAFVECAENAGGADSDDDDDDNAETKKKQLLQQQADKKQATKFSFELRRMVAANAPASVAKEHVPEEDEDFSYFDEATFKTKEEESGVDPNAPVSFRQKHHHHPGSSQQTQHARGNAAPGEGKNRLKNKKKKEKQKNAIAERRGGRNRHHAAAAGAGAQNHTNYSGQY